MLYSNVLGSLFPSFQCLLVQFKSYHKLPLMDCYSCNAGSGAFSFCFVYVVYMSYSFLCSFTLFHHLYKYI